MANARKAIEQKITTGDFYDAQQMVKTVYCRQVAKGQFDSAAELCLTSARQFSEAEQHELAADLGKDLVATLTLREEPVSDAMIARIEAIVKSIPASEATVMKYALLHKALHWSKQEYVRGHPRLHRLAAECHRADGNFGRCQGHFVFCEDGPAFAALVKEWRTHGYPNEADIFGLRSLLMLLTLSDMNTARSFWEALVGADVAPSGLATADQERESPPAPEPPVAAGSFVLAAAEAKDLAFFKAVRAKYFLVFRRDPTFEKYLDEIESKVFGIKVQKAGIGALFDALMGGLSG